MNKSGTRVRRGFLSACCGLMAAICFATAAHAQQGQWVFGTYNDDNIPQRISALPGGGMVSCGDTVTTLHDATGNVVWMMQIKDFYPNAVIPTSDGKLAIVGSYFDGGNTYKIMLVKAEMSGATDWMHVYPGMSVHVAMELIEISTGGYLIALEHLTDDGRRLPFVIRTKADGTTVWMYRYEAPDIPNALGEFCFIEEGVKQDDGQLTFNLTGQLGPFPGNADTLLATIAGDGSPLNSRLIGFDNHTDFGRGLKSAMEGGFLVTGYSKQPGEGGGTYLMHVNDNLTLDWYQSMYGFHGTKEIFQSHNFDAHLVGRLGYPNPVSNMALVAINSLTQTYSWGMQYGGQEQDGAADFEVRANGFDIYGSTKSFDLVPQVDYYLVRTDVNGISGCNEQDLSIPLLPHVPLDTPVQLDPELIADVAQNLPDPYFVEFVERDICDSDCECTPPPPGMTSWWTLDEMVGPIASEAIAGNDGTHIGDAVPAPAMVEYGIALDGAGDYVEVMPAPLLEILEADPVNDEGNFTIDAWIRVDSAASMSWGPIVDKRDWGGGPGYAFFVKDGRLHLELRDIVTGDALYQSTQFLPMGTFVHVGVAVNRTLSYSVRFFVDGVDDVDSTPVTILGSLYNPDAALWIGGMRYTTGPGTPETFFEGIIDEVEIFHRELDTSEIQAIYNAQECGKCKFDCHVPWDVPFCDGDIKVVVDITVENDSPYPSLIDLSFAPLSPSICGNINGPTGFTVLSPSNPVSVPGNSSVVVEVSIDRPVGMTSLWDVGCYEVTLTNLDNGQTNTCRGSVQDRRDWCADVLEPVGGDFLELVPGVAGPVVARLVNTNLADAYVQWWAIAYDGNMQFSDNISVNDSPAGEYAVGELQIRAGEFGDIELELIARNFEGSSNSDLVVFTMNEQTLVPLFSVPIRTIMEESNCIGDIDKDGDVDGADLATLLGSWGKCGGCSADLNGDGVVDGIDLATVLGAWGSC